MNQKGNVKFSGIKIEALSSSIGSISRVSDPRYQASAINMEGNLMSDKWAENCRRCADNGATGLRESPYVIENLEDNVFAPYVLDKTSNLYDLGAFNQRYFDNLREMAEIANKYNLTFYFTLYENPAELYKDMDPWLKNRQEFSTFTAPEASYYRLLWEKKVIATLENLNVAYVLNLPPDVSIQTFRHLYNNGINPDDVIIYLPGSSKLPRQYQKLKKKLFTYHVLGQDSSELTGLSNGTSIFVTSIGDHKPNEIQWQEITYKIMARSKNILSTSRYIFEVVHSKKGDDYNAVRGISAGIYKMTGNYTANYTKFPKLLAQHTISLPVQKKTADMWED